MRWGAVGLLCAWWLSSTAPASAWSTPQDLSSHTGFAFNPSAALDGRGDAVVAWQRQLDAYHTEIDASTRPVGGLWTADQTLSVGAQPQNDTPSVAMDDQGDALAVWLATGYGTRIGTAFAPAGSPFGPEQDLGANDPAAGGNNGAAYPFVSFDGTGEALALWEPETAAVRYAIRSPAGQWTDAQIIANPSSGALAPAFAVSRQGSAEALWMDGFSVYASTRLPGGSFGPAQRLDTGNYVQGPAVAMDPQGDAIAAWGQESSGMGFVRVAFRPAGAASFGPAMTISQTSVNGAVAVSVAMSPQGEATVVFVGCPPGAYYGATSITRAPNGLWGAPAAAIPIDVWPEDPPQIAYDAASTAYMAWRHYDSNNSDDIRGRALAATKAPGQAFGAPVTLSDATHNVWTVALATAAPQSALVAWPIGTFNGDASQFWIQQSDLSTIAQGPHELDPPTVDGSSTVGATLTCLPGQWSGDAPLNYSYQWLRQGAPLEGQQGPEYLTTAADVGQTLACQVTASNAAGTAAPATSPGLAITAPAPPPAGGNGAPTGQPTSPASGPGASPGTGTPTAMSPATASGATGSTGLLPASSGLPAPVVGHPALRVRARAFRRGAHSLRLHVRCDQGCRIAAAIWSDTRFIPTRTTGATPSGRLLTLDVSIPRRALRQKLTVLIYAAETTAPHTSTDTVITLAPLAR
jgi:hypothetical protein